MRARVHPEDAARAVIRQLGARSAAPAESSWWTAAGRLGFARNTRTMTWAAAGESSPTILAGA